MTDLRTRTAVQHAMLLRQERRARERFEQRGLVVAWILIVMSLAVLAGWVASNWRAG